MSIKSVREISFFQSLRDKDLDLYYLNAVPEKTNEEIAYFTYYLLSLANEKLKETETPQLMHLERECIDSLLLKLNPKTTLKNEVVKLTVIETIHLHNILDYFENNFELFKEYTQKNNIPHQLMNFALLPSNFYITIFNIKNNLEHKLGENIVKQYKVKHK